MLPPSPADPLGCYNNYIGEDFCVVEALDPGAAVEIRSLLRITDPESFAVAAYVKPPGGPSVPDANPADNNARLVVGPAAPVDAFAPRPVIGGPAVMLVAPEVTLGLEPGRCRSLPNPGQLYRVSPLINELNATVTYPEGRMESWGTLQGLPVGTSALRVVGRAAGTATEITLAVVVVDSQKPRLLAPAGLRVLDLDATSLRGAPMKLPRFRAFDNCPGVRLETAPAAGSDIPPGRTRVLVKAIDRSGNEATYAYTVNVRGPLEQLALARQLVVGLSGEGRSLAVRLTEIRRLLGDPGTVPSACIPLASFLATVTSLAPETLAARSRTEVVGRIVRLRRSLRC